MPTGSTREPEFDPVSDITFKVNPSLVIFFYFMPPENKRKPEVLRWSQMEKMVRNELTTANSSSFVALR